jgi:hypothetical protein
VIPDVERAVLSGHDVSLAVFALTFVLVKDDDSPFDRRSAVGSHGDGGIGRDRFFFCRGSTKRWRLGPPNKTSTATARSVAVGSKNNKNHLLCTRPVLGVVGWLLPRQRPMVLSLSQKGEHRRSLLEISGLAVAFVEGTGWFGGDSDWRGKKDEEASFVLPE